MTYPGAKHGITGQANRTHAYSTIDAFLRRELMVTPATAAPAADPLAAPVIEKTAEPEQVPAPSETAPDQ